MSRKILLLAMFVAGACVVASPALAKHSRTTHRKLVMTRHFNKRGLRAGHVGAISIVNPNATVSYSNYRCEVTVGTGANGNTPVNYHVTDSTQFYYGYTKDLHFYRTVTSNCIGKLPAGVTAPTATTSHDVACEQFDPLNSSKPLIQGYGISTTFPDGMYSETCNTPDYQNTP